jgi:two-component system CheB/CheR fusion protein
LSHLTSSLDYDRFMDDCREVLRTLASKEAEVRARDDSWHLMRILPYRTAEDVIEGLVITFVEISRVKQAELDTESFCQCFDVVVQTAREPLVMLDLDYRVVAANDAFCRLFRASREQITRKPLREVGDGLWGTPAVQHLLRELSRRPDGVANVEVVDDSPETDRRVFRLNASRVDRGPTAARMIVLALTDVAAGARGSAITD